MLKLNNKSVVFFLQASLAAYGTYFCMYAFRKPFTVATFSALSFWGVDYKVLLIIAQVIGYTISKFLGIKIIAEMKPNQRMPFLIGFIIFAELSLLGFALVPAPINIIFLFLNGLPLGMIWGLVFSYLEGRKTTEILGVVLCASFIVSSGVVKSIGKLVIDKMHFNEFWMPFITGLIFLLPLFTFAFLLERLPKPTASDKESKTIRKPLNRKERLDLYKVFAFPLTIIVFFYILLTGIRDFRDNFTREIWDDLGFLNTISMYSVSEIPITICVFVIMMLIGNVSNNYKAFKYYHLALLLGGFLIGISTIAFQFHKITPLLWMILSGFGIYTCYIPFQGLFFDRMIATFKIKGNVGFLIYIADAFGYLGSILILLFKNFGNQDISYVSFFKNLIFIISIVAVVMSISSYIFFAKKYKNFNKLQQNTL